MPDGFTGAVNVVDSNNSTHALLPAFGTFTGQWVDLTSYAEITVAIRSDQSTPFGGIQIQWSTDGANVNLEPQRFTLDTTSVGPGLTIHATPHARYYRIVYTNWFTSQGTFQLTSILRVSAHGGTVRSIDPNNTFTPDVDAQIVSALLTCVGRSNPQQMQLPMGDDVSFGDGPFLFTSPRPAKDLPIRNAVAASLVPVQLNPFSLSRCTFMSYTNDVVRGNLYIQLGDGSGLSPISYDYKIPPQHVWNEPSRFGSVYIGDVWGVWDYADPAGKARYIVNRYG
ncbi:MAG: hypothetical protein ACREMY_02905 [bacterium]